VNKKDKEEICPMDYAFNRIGGKYKGRIIWHLNENKVLRYGELKKLITGITTKMLTQTLKELVVDKLVVRKVYPQVPPKVEYYLTPPGLELVPFINYLREWANLQLQNHANIKHIHSVKGSIPQRDSSKGS
jgi:DNA-binding HxlR family transcriptional regulator